MGSDKGGPLSLLFVLAANLLQSIVNDGVAKNIITHPLGQDFGGDYPIVQYVDDTLLVMLAESFSTPSL